MPVDNVHGGRLLICVEACVLEGLCTGGVCGVRDGFLRVATVVVHLEENCDVHAHLQETTDPKLHGSLSHQKVTSLKSVSTGPHQHHLNARRTESEKIRV